MPTRVIPGRVIRSRHDTLQPDQIFRIGQLDIIVRSGDDFHGFAGGFEQRGIVGGAGQAGPVGGQQRLEPECLGVWARNRPARGTVSVMTPRMTRFSVSATGSGRDGARRFAQRGQQGGDGAGRDEWPGGVVDQNDVGFVRGQGLQTGAHAVLAGCATWNGG